MSLIRTIRRVTYMAIVLNVAIFAQGQVIPIDDFDDMVFDGWTTLDFSAGQPWGPGAYDVSNGDLRMYHTGSTPVPPNIPLTERVVAAAWDQSTDPIFSNGYVRGQVRTDSAYNSTSVLFRFDLNTFSGYVFFGNTTPVPPGTPGSEFAISKLVNGTEIRIWDSGIPYGPGEDWNFEYGAVGSQITAKVWRVGEPEPSTPQFSGIDTSVVAGQIYLTSDVITADTPSFADATFDNLVFVVPEPATSWLGVWLVAGLLTRRIRAGVIRC